HNIYLNKKKCNFMKREIKILGHIIKKSERGIDPQKIEFIEKCPIPRNIKELRSFLGFANYCRSFIPRFADIAQPLNNLLKGKSPRSECEILHTQETTDAFKTLKKSVKEHLIRAQPDFSKRFIVIIDASKTGISGILAQVGEDGVEKIVSCFSRSLSKSEENYSATDLELLAVIKTLEHYRHYLLGKQFSLRTDHQALLYMQKSENHSSRLMRWSLKLQEYNFTIEHVKGPDNAADHLSRVRNITMRDEQKISSDQRKEILVNYHITLGHGAPPNMNFNIRKKYKWTGMSKDIADFCDSCKICQREGFAANNTKNKMIITKKENELWQMDLIGPIGTGSKKGYIIIILDHYSKWIKTQVITKKTDQNILEFLKSVIQEEQKTPKRIVVDSGKEFNNGLLKDFCDRSNITLEFASQNTTRQLAQSRESLTLSGIR
ncbi:LTR retrotransposable element, partial [Pseudoloma neurophilia]